MNNQNSWDEYCDRIDTLMQTGNYRSRHEAGLAVKRTFPHLAAATPPGMQSNSSGRSATYGNAEAELDRLAKQIAAERHVSFAQAYVEVLSQNPRLYEAYLREHLERLGGGAGRV